MRSLTGVLSLLGVAVLLLVVACFGAKAESANTTKTVYIVSITDDIDLGLAPFVERAVKEANANKPAAINK